MADGYILLEINHEGGVKVQNDEVYWFDFRHQDVLFFDAEGPAQLADQIQKGLRDVLVMVVFKYTCNCSKDYFGDMDCEEIFEAVHSQVVKENYKEFRRELITEELNYGINGYENIDAMPEDAMTNHYKDIVGEWEEFYDEDFAPYVKTPKKLIKVDGLWDLLQDS